MKDTGLNAGLVQKFETSDRRSKHAFYGFRKMFWDYLTKMNVVFYDACCVDAGIASRKPVSFDETTSGVQYFDGTAWVTAESALTGLAAGTVSVPSLSFTSDANTGLYQVSADNLGITAGGVQSASFSATNVTLKPVIAKVGTSKAVNVTGSVTAAELAGGHITSTSAAAVNVTLPLATDIATQIGAVAGTRFQFIVDNSAGANTVTIVVNTGITVTTPAITGGATLTVSTANAVAVFELIFTSATAAKLVRLV